METTLPSDFQTAVRQYLQGALDAPGLEITSLTLAPGGASRDTWLASVTYAEPGGVARRELVLRVDKDLSLLPSSRPIEYEAYQALAKEGSVPIPAPVSIENDPAVIGQPFFVVERVAGDAWPAALLSDEFAGDREDIGRQAVEVLGHIHRLDPQQLGFDRFLPMPAPNTAWAQQLDHWEAVLDGHLLGSRPVTRAAIRYLRRTPPPAPKRITIVHGDFRIGNFLFTDKEVAAVLDWEMVHLGDPHEDLAWFCARNWRARRDPSRMSGLLTRTETLERWTAASGLTVNPDALDWWTIFTHVKAQGLWATADKAFATIRSDDVMYASFGYLQFDREERWMLEDMKVAP
jgi:aminoglycoside phosphotransferase (APT) family kinase protein